MSSRKTDAVAADDAKLSKGKRAANNVAALLRARNPLIWIVSKEEARIEAALFEAAASAGYVAHFWDAAQGVTDIADKTESVGSTDISETLAAIRFKAKEGPSSRDVWVLRDLPAWLGGPGGVVTLRALRNLARMLPGTARERAQSIVVLSPSSEVPPELVNHAAVIEWPLPDREEMAAILDATVNALPEFDKAGNPIRSLAVPGEVRERAIDAAIGLTQDEAAACFAHSLVLTKRIDVALVTAEKKRVIGRVGGLEWYDPLPGGLDAVGGMECLKEWLVARKDAYTPEARAYGLPSPKGVFLAGISGCGKSYLSKAIATTWGIPLVRIDLGALKSKFVGDSEGNLRKAFRIIEAIGRCVVWFDEIEKALQGATSGSADGGVSSDALGAVLTWMQERQGEAFVIATANEIEGLPPEILRKGRFDELWFVDLPTAEERKAVLASALKSLGRGSVDVDYDAISAACTDFTGAEIAALVPDAMFAAFGDGAREICTQDLIAAAKAVTPLAVTAKAKIDALRAWSKDKARSANRAVAAEDRKSVRELDL